MNGTQIALIMLVTLLAFPATTAADSNETAMTTDMPQNGFAAMANERLPDRAGPPHPVHSLHELLMIGQDGALPQQSGTPVNESTAGTGQTASPDADFEITGVDSEIESGEQGTIEVTIENQGENARNTVVTFRSQSSALVFGESATTSEFIGEWDDGESRTIEVEANVPPGGAGRDYPVQVTVSYEDDDGNQTRSAALAFGVTPGEEADDFEIVSTSSDVWVGGTGNLTVALENQGGDTEDAVVTLGTLSSDITFGGAANTSQFVGEWEDGERKTVEVGVSATPSANERDYPLQTTVAHEEEGQQTQAGPYLFSITPEGEQDFTLSDVDGSLSVGETGSITGTITNEGPKTVRDATVVFAANASDIAPRQSEVVLGTLEPGESADFEYPFAVNRTTEAGERQLPFVVQYQNPEGELFGSTQLNSQVTIDDRTDDFELSNVESNVQVGDTGTVELTIRNAGTAKEGVSVTLDSTNGQILFGNSTSATQFVGAWEANATKTIRFQTTATPDASVESYALNTKVNYQSSDGQSVASQQLSMRITPLAEQTFDLHETNTTLRIGRDGYINGTVTNTGPLPVVEATVRLGNLSGIESERGTYPLGDLAVGETANFTFPVSVTGGAVGPQQIQYTIIYTGPADNRQADTKLLSGVYVGSREPLLTTAIDDATVTVQETEVMNVSVTNHGNETLRNIQAIPNVSGSLEISPTSLFVSSLEPGETSTLQLEIDADDVENPSQIPLTIDFQYETASNEIRQIQAPPVGIEVVAAESGLITGPTVVGAVLVIVVVGSLILYLR